MPLWAYAKVSFFFSLLMNSERLRPTVQRGSSCMTAGDAQTSLNQRKCAQISNGLSGFLSRYLLRAQSAAGCGVWSARKRRLKMKIESESVRLRGDTCTTQMEVEEAQLNQVNTSSCRGPDRFKDRAAICGECAAILKGNEGRGAVSRTVVRYKYIQPCQTQIRRFLWMP